jgi:hypothetical protein
MKTGTFCKIVLACGVTAFTAAVVAEPLRCWYWPALSPCEEIKIPLHLTSTASNTMAVNVLLPRGPSGSVG